MVIGRTMVSGAVRAGWQKFAKYIEYQEKRRPARRRLMRARWNKWILSLKVFSRLSFKLFEVQYREHLDYGHAANENEDYSTARQEYRRALQICTSLWGPESIQAGDLVARLGSIHLDIGDFVEAQKLCSEAIRIFDHLGNQDRRIGAMHTFSIALIRSGDFERAVDICKQRLEFIRPRFGPKQLASAIAESTLGVAYLRSGNYEQARCLFESSLEMFSRGDEHDEVGQIHRANTLGKLGELYLLQRELSASKVCYEESLSITERFFGSKHSRTAAALIAVGRLLEVEGDYEAAEDKYRTALVIHGRTYGANNFTTLRNISELARLTALREPRQAAVLFRAVLEAENTLLRHVLASNSERGRLLHLITVQAAFHDFILLLVSRKDIMEEFTSDAYSLVLKRKAITTEIGIAQRAAILGRHSARVSEVMRELTATRDAIVRVVLDEGRSRNSEDHDPAMSELETRVDELERQLVQEIPELKGEMGSKACNSSTVKSLLNDRTALLEFVIIGNASNTHSDDSSALIYLPQFICFVVRNGSIEAINLGDAGIINNQVENHRLALVGDSCAIKTRVLDLESGGIREDDLNWLETSRALSEVLWRPLEKTLENCEELIISPDHNLPLVPFETLQNSNGTLLADTYKISYITCGRDLARTISVSHQTSGPALVIADPDYDAGEEECGTSRQSEASGFVRLLGTRLEGIAVAEALSVAPVLGAEATKDVVRNCVAPKILHLATHGFFIRQWSDGKRHLRDIEESSQAGILAQLASAANPMLRSGIALAGANALLRALNDGRNRSGLLTAEEVAEMKLFGTDLVVLSACETGIGDVQAGEGILGLRRAFVLAGAKALVTSLWKVSDEVTRELMELFYVNIKSGDAPNDALRQAQKEIRNTYQHPYYWASFICQGGNLRLNARELAGIESPAHVSGGGEFAARQSG